MLTENKKEQINTIKKTTEIDIVKLTAIIKMIRQLCGKTEQFNMNIQSDDDTFQLDCMLPLNWQGLSNSIIHLWNLCYQDYGKAEIKLAISVHRFWMVSTIIKSGCDTWKIKDIDITMID